MLNLTLLMLLLAGAGGPDFNVAARTTRSLAHNRGNVEVSVVRVEPLPNTPAGAKKFAIEWLFANYSEAAVGRVTCRFTMLDSGGKALGTGEVAIDGLAAGGTKLKRIEIVGVDAAVVAAWGISVK